MQLLLQSPIVQMELERCTGICNVPQFLLKMLRHNSKHLLVGLKNPINVFEIDTLARKKNLLENFINLNFIISKLYIIISIDII